MPACPSRPGFTITTEACNAYYDADRTLPEGLWENVLAHMTALEGATGKGFGNAENPLLVSVRSGAAFSMPGMMDTVLNLGLNEQTVAGLILLTENERFGYDAWRRFVAMFGRIVQGIPGVGLRRAARGAEGAAARRGRHRPHRGGAARAGGAVSADRRGAHRRAVPGGSVQAARARHPGGLRQLVRQAGA